MADIYTQFAFAIANWPKPAIAHVLALAAAVDALGDGEEVPEGTPADLAERAGEIADFYDRGTDARCEEEEDGLVIWAEDHGCVGAVADIIQHAMAAHGIEEPVFFEYADTCSRFRPGHFGGGAVVIDAQGQDWMDTNTWAKEAAQRRKSGAPRVAVVVSQGLVEAIVGDIAGRAAILDADAPEGEGRAVSLARTDGSMLRGSLTHLDITTPDFDLSTLKG